MSQEQHKMSQGWESFLLPSDVIVKRAETRVSVVDGLQGIEATPFISGRRNIDGVAGFDLGLGWANPQTGEQGFRLVSDEGFSLDYTTALRAFHILSRCSAYPPYIIEACIDLITERKWGREMHRLIHNEYVDDVNVSTELKPQEFLELALGGMKVLESTHREAIAIEPSEEEREELKTLLGVNEI